MCTTCGKRSGFSWRVESSRKTNRKLTRDFTGSLRSYPGHTLHIWQIETQRGKSQLQTTPHNIAYTLVVPVCPNQIEGRHNNVFSACTTNMFI